MAIISGGGAPAVTQGPKVVLNDASVKSLPTTTLPTVIPAPGVSRIVLPQMILLRVTIVGAYTGIDADGSDLGFYWYDGVGTVQWSNNIANSVGYSIADLTGLLTTVGTRNVLLTPDKSTAQQAGAPNQIRQPSNDESIMVNGSVILSVTNNADFTGGNAGNSMTVVPYYTTLSV